MEFIAREQFLRAKNYDQIPACRSAATRGTEETFSAYSEPGCRIRSKLICTLQVSVTVGNDSTIHCSLDLVPDAVYGDYTLS